MAITDIVPPGSPAQRAANDIRQAFRGICIGVAAQLNRAKELKESVPLQDLTAALGADAGALATAYNAFRDQALALMPGLTIPTL